MGAGKGKKPRRTSLHNVYPQEPRPRKRGATPGLRAVLQVRSEVCQDVARPGKSAGPPSTTIPGVGALAGIHLHPLAIKMGVSESAVLAVLVHARKLIRRGWCQGVPWCGERGQYAHNRASATHFSLVGAVRTAGQGDLVGEYAVKLLRKVSGEYDLEHWQDNPVRTRGEVLALLDRAVIAAGGVELRRGGWLVAGAA